MNSTNTLSNNKHTHIPKRKGTEDTSSRAFPFKGSRPQSHLSPPVTVVCLCGKRFSCASTLIYPFCKGCSVAHKKATGSYFKSVDPSLDPLGLSRAMENCLLVGAQSEEVKTDVPPAPRLVGVELNPGPQMSQMLGTLGKKKTIAKAKPKPSGKRPQQRKAGKGMAIQSSFQSVESNAQYSNVFRSSGAPQTVSNDEYVSSINGVTAANSTALGYIGNAGATNLFPWLAPVAQNFQRYKFRKLEFYYKPRVSGFATSGTQGRLVFAFNYDASDPIPTTVAGMESLDPHIDCMPYESLTLKLDPQQLKGMSSNGHYVRVVSTGSGTAGFIGDAKTYDIGTFLIMVSGTADTNTIGELRVRYIVDLFNPIVASSLNSIPINHTTMGLYDPTNTQSFVSGVTTNVNFGTGTLIQVNGIGAVVGPLPTVNLTLQPGSYLISGMWNYVNAGNQITKVGTQAVLVGVPLPQSFTAWDDSGVAAGAKQVNINFNPFVVNVGTTSNVAFQVRVTTADASATTLNYWNVVAQLL